MSRNASAGLEPGLILNWTSDPLREPDDNFDDNFAEGVIIFHSRLLLRSSQLCRAGKDQMGSPYSVYSTKDGGENWRRGISELDGQESTP
jgi:hypothetical protein